jgi:hypothetical protein
VSKACADAGARQSPIAKVSAIVRRMAATLSVPTRQINHVETRGVDFPAAVWSND